MLSAHSLHACTLGHRAMSSKVARLPAAKTRSGLRTRCTQSLHHLSWPWARGCHKVSPRCCWHLRRAIPLRLVIPIGIMAWPGASMRTIGISMPATLASTATTSIPTRGKLSTIPLGLPTLFLSHLNGKLQVLERGIICAIVDLEPGLSHRVPMHISDLGVLEESVREVQRCTQDNKGLSAFTQEPGALFAHQGHQGHSSGHQGLSSGHQGLSLGHQGLSSGHQGLSQHMHAACGSQTIASRGRAGPYRPDNGIQVPIYSHTGNGQPGTTHAKDL